MPQYKAPLADIFFVLDSLLESDKHYQCLPLVEPLTPDLLHAIVEEAAKFAEQEIAPLNPVGDEQGCHFQQGRVTTPEGFKEAYQLFCESGWSSLSHSQEWGGQGLPESLSTVLNEMLGSANWAWNMYQGLSQGAIKTLSLFADQQLKSHFLPKMVSGEWSGTMCLTEPHCGSDLGLLRSRAEPLENGRYKITGNKIFISAGEHDLTENIVHIVLARLSDAPAGVKGISLFVVPKFLSDEQGNLLTQNTLSCGSVEKKMGIHGNATCALNFDGAEGYLLGQPNQGLAQMFVFMNSARLGTALQGLAHTEWGYQNSLSYAQERLQMRSLRGVKNPDKEADPIIVHPEVRKMLLIQRSIAEAGRAFIYDCSLLVDKVNHSCPDAKQAEEKLALLTPIAKAFLTEMGLESASHALQVFGGQGYIREWGVEQNLRDARISTIYEGTTQIQALDLLVRKVILDRGRALTAYHQELTSYCERGSDNQDVRYFKQQLADCITQWRSLTAYLAHRSMLDRDELGAAAVDYLMYSGYVVLAYYWSRMAESALQKMVDGSGADRSFYKMKIDTANFYYQRLLPRRLSLAETIRSGAANLDSSF